LALIGFRAIGLVAIAAAAFLARLPLCPKGQSFLLDIDEMFLFIRVLSSKTKQNQNLP
jgi:hypothetical protein